MDISKARRLVELEKEGRKVLLTLYEGNLVSSCIEEQEKKFCETCQCEDGVCQEYIEHMKAQGYQATEIELGELELEESLPRFLQQREIPIEVQPVVEQASVPGEA